MERRHFGLPAGEGHRKGGPAGASKTWHQKHSAPIVPISFGAPPPKEILRGSDSIPAEMPDPKAKKVYLMLEANMRAVESSLGVDNFARIRAAMTDKIRYRLYFAGPAWEC